MAEEKILNNIDVLARKHISRYYAGWLVCEDPGCTGRTRLMPLQFQRAFPVCPTCRSVVIDVISLLIITILRVSSMYKEYSDDQLYTQLSYLDYLLDCQKMKQVLSAEC